MIHYDLQVIMGKAGMTLKILGAGFGRTGTDSLKKAIEILGLGPCHHMYEVRDNLDLLPAWVNLSKGGPPDWPTMFKGYNAQVDWPGAAYWQDLVAQYPDAKVILTVRDPHAWFQSMQQTIIRFVAARGTFDEPHQNEIGNFIQRAIVERIFDGRIDDEDYATRRFEEHVAEVRASVPDRQLLVYDVASGWPNLCDFLGCSIPDLPFPSGNSAADFASRRNYKTGN